ncbi:cytochrome P450 82A4 [Medicago truncatula]|uniref:Cytochrome P450 family protein n=2 Tax=Medicago truncatula TaxID=3880 RepID=G7KJF1_MEDTR|nr:cytochrome P450 82A4 [Medicago truncatula]AES74579.1 cytochrome P450 family protein [Medicago truncatula]
MDLVLSSLINGTTIALLYFIPLCLILFGFSKVVHSKNKEAPIAEGAWPILGHLSLFRGTQSPHRVLGTLADKYGPLFTIKLGTKHALILNNWEMAKECFTTNDTVVSSRPKLVATEHLGYNGAMFGLAPYGPYWRQLRKIVTLEVLTNRRVKQQQHVRVPEVQASIKELFNVWTSKNNESYSSNYVLVELDQWFTHLTFNMVLRMVVGKRYFGLTTSSEEEESKRCVNALKKWMHLLGVITVGDIIPCLNFFDFGGYVKTMKETSKELDKIFDEWLKERRHKRTLVENLDDQGNQDIMDVLLSLLDGTTIEGFDGDTIIKATLLTMFSGGSDTSSVTLTWALCLLLNNPLVMEKAKEELDAQVGKERCLSEFDINKLIYLQAIVKETLRLYPPGPLSGPREFSKNCNLGGYQVIKGTRLITNLWKIQTDPSVWPDPLEFKPERFFTTHKAVDVRGNHFELLPFGSGRRKCPGISFGLQMLHFTLASFLHSFDILNPTPDAVDMSEAFGSTNSKATPLEILIKPRLSHNCYEFM